MVTCNMVYTRVIEASSRNRRGFKIGCIVERSSYCCSVSETFQSLDRVRDFWAIQFVRDSKTAERYHGMLLCEQFSVVFTDLFQYMKHFMYHCA